MDGINKIEEVLSSDNDEIQPIEEMLVEESYDVSIPE